MRTTPRLFVASFLLLAAGCSVVAGVQDIAYGDPTPATTASPTDPAKAEAGASSPTSAHDASATSPASDDDASAAPADADADVAVDASDAAVVVIDDPPPPPPPPPPGAAPCTPLEFLAGDRRAPNLQRVITLAPAAAGGVAQYTPRCMSIKAGQSVTFMADFVMDPLEARSQMPPSPIMPVAAGNSATFTFAQNGRYRYGSTANPSLGGAIDVRP